MVSEFRNKVDSLVSLIDTYDQWQLEIKSIENSLREAKEERDKLLNDMYYEVEALSSTLPKREGTETGYVPRAEVPDMTRVLSMNVSPDNLA